MTLFWVFAPYYQTTLCNIPEDGELHIRRRANLKLESPTYQGILSTGVNSDKARYYLLSSI
jgi:hypothetical protein